MARLLAAAHAIGVPLPRPAFGANGARRRLGGGKTVGRRRVGGIPCALWDATGPRYRGIAAAADGHLACIVQRNDGT
jgi:hypothetical protein